MDSNAGVRRPHGRKVQGHSVDPKCAELPGQLPGVEPRLLRSGAHFGSPRPYRCAKWRISPLQTPLIRGYEILALEQPMTRLYGYGMAELSRLPRPVADEWEWQYQGICRDLPTEMFFHPDGERGPRRRNRENTAKAICATCPVILACRKHALAVQEPYGIWGGLSEDDRLAIIGRDVEPKISHAS